MRGKMTLTGIVLLGSMAISACGCSKDGEYYLEYLEYIQDGDTKKTDCLDISTLPDTVKSACQLVNLTNSKESLAFRIESNKIYYGDSDEGLFFKIENNSILTSTSENGIYIETGLIYKNNKIIDKVNNISYVYKK